MLKILLADDSAPNRLKMAQIIHSLGYIPVMASNGQRCLDILEDNLDIAAVVSDCQMPVMDGPSMVREIRRRDGGRLPVLLYSSYITVNEVGALLDIGATAFLNYPVSRESLKEYLERHLPHA